VIEWFDIKKSTPPCCPDYVVGAIGKMYLVYFFDLRYEKKSYNVGVSEWVYGEKRFRNDPDKSTITHWSPVNFPGIVDFYIWDELQYDRCRDIDNAHTV